MNTPDYFLKANLYALLFAGCYWLLLRRHTFFTANRAYLLLSAGLALTFPLMHLPAQTVETMPVPMGVITLPTAMLLAVPAEVVPADLGPNWAQIGLLTYGLVAMILLLQLGVRLGRLSRLIRRSPRRKVDDYMLVQPADSIIPTFSFFRYLVLNPADAGNKLIIDHERVHIRQHHSADVLGMAVLRALFWPCPALWLIDRLLRQVHEFLADGQTHQPADYAQFLVEYAFSVRPEPLTNGFFNPSLLKLRIRMLRQRATTRWALGKYVLVLPLAFGLLAMTTAREEIATVINRSTSETINVAGRVTSAVDGKPLPGVTVVIKNTRRGTTTDSDGKYQLSNVPKDGSLVYSFVGFVSQDVNVDGHTAIDVTMAVATTDLDKVYVVAGDPAPKPMPEKPVTATKPLGKKSPDGEFFLVVEQQPEFPGGMKALFQYLSRNLRYPAEAQKNKVQGRVYVRFVISKTGEIGQVRVLKGIGSGADEEAVRVVSQMPKWIPGKQQGQSVPVQFNLPIQFELEKRADNKTGQVTPTPQPDSPKKVGLFDDDSKNRRLTIYNNSEMGSLQRYAMPLPDSLRKSGISVYIRGNGFSEGDPLYLIDSLEITKEELHKKLNTNDIESITVLKNSAAFIYGEKGKNGVILIKTKKK